MIQRVGVIGAGQMGTGIALVTAMHAKLPVMIQDISPVMEDRSREFSKSLLAKNVKKGKMTQDEADTVFSRISYCSKLEEVGGNSDFLIEAAVEDPKVKENIFEQLDQFANPDVIVATNTSSIPITRIAAATKRPEKVIGMHFFSPVPVMPLCEIISGLSTSSETIETTTNLAKSMGKTTTISQDRPGFISNRILMPYINEAFFVLQDGIATAEDIDKTMKLGTNSKLMHGYNWELLASTLAAAAAVIASRILFFMI